MRKTRNLLLLLFILATISTQAQKADSVIVIYDSQKIVIPVPEFGKQTSIKMADTVQIIEIGVSKRKVTDILLQTQYSSHNVTVEKPLKKTKWYSQIEAGYIIKFVPDHSSESATINSEPVIINFNTDDMHGYKIGISIFENERYLSNKFSYISGFKLGFAQSFKASKNSPIFHDSVLHLYVGYTPLTISRIQFLFPFGFRQYFGYGKSNYRINFGSNIGSSIELTKIRGGSGYSTFGGSPVFIQPFFGFEKGKIGILTTADISSAQSFNYDTRSYIFKIGYGIGFALTYRLF